MNNIMVRKVGDDVYGVLNDFDLAKKEGVQPESFQRTGTQPYMAIDLLDPDDRLDDANSYLPRFDHESLFYILLWRACCPNDVNRKDIHLPSDHELLVWRTEKWKALSGSKYALMNRPRWPPFSADFQSLSEHVLRNFRHLLSQGLIARTRLKFLSKSNGPSKQFDERWLGGHLTEANVKGVLWDSSSSSQTTWAWPQASVNLEMDPRL